MRYSQVLTVALLTFLGAQAQAQQLFFEPHMTLDPPEEGIWADNETVQVGGTVDVGFAGAVFDSLPWLVGEAIAGVRPPRDAGLGEVGASHISVGVRAQLPGTFRPGVFVRGGPAWVVLRQSDNTGASFLPIWSVGAMQDFHLDRNFFFGFAVAWEQYWYDTTGFPSDSDGNASIEWVLVSARIGWNFGE